MNIQKLVDSLDSNELKNLAKLLEKKLEKSEMEKAIKKMQEAYENHTPIEFYGQTCGIEGAMRCVDLGRETLTFYLDNGSKIVFG